MKLLPPTEKRVHQVSVRLSEAELNKLDQLVETLRKKWGRLDVDRIDILRSAIEAVWQELCAPSPVS